MLTISHAMQLISVPVEYKLLIKERLCICGNVEIVLIEWVDDYFDLYGHTMPFDGFIDSITAVICIAVINNSEVRETIIPKYIFAQLPFLDV
ncbi:MAG: hypothetical protein WBI40_00270 [Methylococcaceae bacterium]